MKALNRHSSSCVDGLSEKTTDWMDAPKDAIWIELDKMQQGFCAYCECQLNRKHIEHFRTRSGYPKETFNWNNLFGSCGDSSRKGGWNRCGIFKDNGAGPYDINDLVKPDSHNPSDYLLFLTTGEVTFQPNLLGQDKKIAEETIRVFNLNNDAALFNSRKNAIRAIEQEVEVLYSLKDEFQEEEWQSLLEESIETSKGFEFQTALEHTWRYNKSYAD
ncbi:retron Ec78 anti-phage system effector HNH endonuclease PtuB [Vibrio coralliilyticus]|uniref:retron Ec78 anti-phage system effector HNH endonuclease PtuB n=1 Tax=Vibrio coralliilyticus TaxID=190893 RepID=UPI00068C14F5|nr:retron Ec78 anti-phage system effector HNH endonuclease PtuB [Vibrio coralliilyticus]